VEPDADLERRISGIAALDQPVRRDLYRLLTARGEVTRDDASSALDIPRSVAAFHLDKLAEARVVEVRFERLPGRTGPGAGRPSKRYRLASEELAASIPQRRYDLAGTLLAAAIDESIRTGAPVADRLRVAARSAGRAAGEEAAEASAGARSKAERRQALLDVLAEYGYEPELDRRKVIALANCPFHRLAQQHRDLVCGMNLDFLIGLTEASGEAGRWAPRLKPTPGYCCVRIHAS
jgi:predicted ArsR family transcriptional regulator